ncbi:di-trans,poly-cis-decaprenylcistransferase [Puccinia sorghi]|uniref:Alkyl transferase n=1 Tax=Puccinia sorghi TaxID=27349 RepID=A0A0L6UQ13_9BASI|nr:di-trans,poly-cis-decaprenylcistransferase [Puccinia sorghi]
MDRMVWAITRLIPARLYPYLRTVLIKSLQMGPLPRHVGFIMDGNRRFSRATGVAIEEGHLAGFEALKRILELLLRLNIPNVTIYAFAIENFNRPHSEVNKLMDLARTKLVQICEKGQLLDRYGIRVVVIGRKDLLPTDIRQSVEKVEAMTKQNTKQVVVLASRKMNHPLQAGTVFKRRVPVLIAGRNGVGNVHERDGDNELWKRMRRNEQVFFFFFNRSMMSMSMMEKNLYTAHSAALDMLIRTSGETRLSDFMLWQTSLLSLSHLPSPSSSSASVHFVPTFWPRFGILDVLPILLGWQAEQISSRLFPFLFPYHSRSNDASGYFARDIHIEKGACK